MQKHAGIWICMILTSFCERKPHFSVTKRTSIIWKGQRCRFLIHISLTNWTDKTRLPISHTSKKYFRAGHVFFSVSLSITLLTVYHHFYFNPSLRLCAVIRDSEETKAESLKMKYVIKSADYDFRCWHSGLFNPLQSQHLEVKLRRFWNRSALQNLWAQGQSDKYLSFWSSASKAVITRSTSNQQTHVKQPTSARYDLELQFIMVMWLWRCAL